jgi:hypothetical protein
MNEREQRGMRNVRMNAKARTALAEKQVAEFNRDHSIGAKVRYWTATREGEGIVSRTRTLAQVLSGHTTVVWVEGYAACIALSHVEVAPFAAPREGK